MRLPPVASSVPAPPKGSKGDEATVAWIRERFRRYYRGAVPDLPPRFARREFGFMFWEAGMMQRHQSFKSAEALRDFLAQRTPMHVYYSSAYYDKPGAPTMEEKGWLGADLVFDLDADHIPGSDKMSYEEMLEAVKRKIIQLYDDFLAADLGFEEGSMKVVFSGGRGYHIHVNDERVWSLGSHERREIVDYITGKEVDVHGFFKESAFDAREFRGHTKVKKMLVSPETSDPGWAGKLARGIVTLAERLQTLPSKEVVDFLAGFEGVGGDNGASDLYENLFKVRSRLPRPIRGVDRLREEGRLEVLTDKNRDRFLNVVLQLQQVRMDMAGPLDLDGIRARGETDEPVTSDIKRLIRMPHSLHGKTGLAVVPMRREDLESFLPLRDAVPRAWTDEPVRVRLGTGIKITMRDENFNLKEGTNTVPEYLAILLSCRGVASIAG